MSGDTKPFEECVESVRLNGMPRFYHCEPQWSWAPPPLPDYDIWCVLDGEGEMLLGGRPYPLGAGVCFVVPPGATPRARHNPLRRLHVFTCHFLMGAAVPDRLPVQDFVLRDIAYLHALARRCVAAHARGDVLGGEQERLLLRLMLLHLWEESRAPSTVAPEDALLHEIATAIREEPGRAWSVEEQAVRACLSRAQYTRRFVSQFGVPPNRFVVETRLERAAQLIAETEMTLTQIAAALGYRDLFFFSRQFKRYRGLSPGALRRKDSSR